MPFRMLPNTDASSLAALRELKRKQGTTPIADWPFIEAQGIENVACFTLLDKEIGERESAEALRSGATALTEAAMNRTQQITSHFIQTLNNGIDRAALKREDRAFYSLGLDQGDVPAMTSAADVLQWANNVIQGEARRAAAQGAAYKAVTFPSAAEVQTELTAFEDLRAAQGTAATAAITEAQDVENIRPRIGLAIHESWDAIEYKNRRLDAPARRAIAREWGVIYVSRPGEAPEAGVDPAPTEGTGGTSGTGSGGTGSGIPTT